MHSCEFSVELTNGPFNVPKQLPPTSMFNRCQEARVAQMDVKLTSQGLFFRHTSEWNQRLLVLHPRTGCLFIYTKGRLGFGVKLPNALKVVIKAVKIGPHGKKVKSCDEYPNEVVRPICYYIAKFSNGTIQIRLPSQSNQEWKHLLADCHDPVRFGLATEPVMVGPGEYESQTRAIVRGYSTRRSRNGPPVPPVRTSSLPKSIRESTTEVHYNSDTATGMIVDELEAPNDDDSQFELDTSAVDSDSEKRAIRYVTRTVITSPIESQNPDATNIQSPVDVSPPRTPFKRTRAVRRHPPSSAVLE
uniref:IRS-type PTB domain-containing protein n=1 Tax=Panagrellus redivivus TaxID=6233 RepID=A0A7E4V990_PANRE